MSDDERTAYEPRERMTAPETDKPAWTEGPWTIVPRNRLSQMIGSNSGNNGIWVAEAKGGDSEANAHLIAAAPDLYEALEAFNLTKEQIVSGSADSLTVKIPLSVIRKAATAPSRARGEG